MIRRPPRSTLFPYTRSSDLLGKLNGQPRSVNNHTQVKRMTDQVGRLLAEQNGLPPAAQECAPPNALLDPSSDRKSTRLNSSHLVISYAVFCLKKKKNISKADVCVVACADAWRVDRAVLASAFGVVLTLGELLAKMTVSPALLVSDVDSDCLLS